MPDHLLRHFGVPVVAAPRTAHDRGVDLAAWEREQLTANMQATSRALCRVRQGNAGRRPLAADTVDGTRWPMIPRGKVIVSADPYRPDAQPTICMNPADWDDLRSTIEERADDDAV